MLSYDDLLFLFNIILCESYFVLLYLPSFVTNRDSRDNTTNNLLLLCINLQPSFCTMSAAGDAQKPIQKLSVKGDDGNLETEPQRGHRAEP